MSPFCESKWIKGHLWSSTIVSQDGAFELLLARGARRNRSRDVLVELQAEARLNEGEIGIVCGSVKTASRNKNQIGPLSQWGRGEQPASAVTK